MLDTKKLPKPKDNLPDLVTCPLSGLPCVTYISGCDKAGQPDTEKLPAHSFPEYEPTDPLGIKLKELVKKIVGGD